MDERRNESRDRSAGLERFDEIFNDTFENQEDKASYFLMGLKRRRGHLAEMYFEIISTRSTSPNGGGTGGGTLTALRQIEEISKSFLADPRMARLQRWCAEKDRQAKAQAIHEALDAALRAE